VVWVIRVPKKDAERVRKKLVKQRLLAREWSIVEDGDFVIFPVTTNIAGSENINLPDRRCKEVPYKKIESLLHERGIFFKTPQKWEKIGDVVLLPHFGADEFLLPIIGEVYAKVLKAKTVAIYEGVSGEYRENAVKLIWGKDTDTVHVENGIKYAIDVSRLMFSSGNIDERIRISQLNMSGEIVVDMFSGIGYFTLPSVKAGAKKIYACEKNPVAFYYLLKNRELNDMDNIVPLYGDNRVVCPIGMADRILMGYFDTFDFFYYALRYLNKEGGIIHYHDLVRDKDESELVHKLRAEADKMEFQIATYKKRIVKSYAPHVWHVVLDIVIEKK